MTDAIDRLAAEEERRRTERTAFAQLLRSHGVAAVPLRPDGKPAVKIGPYRGRCPSDAELRDWLDRHPEAAWGAVAGRAVVGVRVDDGCEADLPPTWCAVGAAGERVALYSAPPFDVPSGGIPGQSGVRRLGRGAVVPLPPMGGLRWTDGCAPGDVGLAPCPAWLLEGVPRPPRAVFDRAADVQPEEARYVLGRLLPRRALVVFVGKPGSGKSVALAAVTTAVSLGVPLPGDAVDPDQVPESVVYVGSEEDPAAVIRPRLERMGADLTRVYLRGRVEGPEGQRPFTLPKDTGILLDALREIRPAVAIIDPLVELEDSGIDTHRQAAQRAILAPLRHVAEELDLCLVFVRHTRKAVTGTDDPNAAVIGSVDSVAAARVVVQVAVDPGDHNPEPDARRRVLAVSKSALGPRPKPRAFFIRDPGILEWDLSGSAPSAEDLFALPETAEDRTERSRVDEAVAFIRDILTGGPATVASLRDGAKQAGLSWRTLERAKERLNRGTKAVVEAGRYGAGSTWAWRLSDTPGGNSADPATHTDVAEMAEMALVHGGVDQNTTPPTPPTDSSWRDRRSCPAHRITTEAAS